MNVIVPLGKRVIVEPEGKEKVSSGGIIIPETANQKAPTKGRVMSIADDSEMKLKVQSGDLVLFSKYSGVEITLPATKPGEKDRTLLIMKDEDLLAVIERKD